LTDIIQVIEIKRTFRIKDSFFISKIIFSIFLDKPEFFETCNVRDFPASIAVFRPKQVDRCSNPLNRFEIKSMIHDPAVRGRKGVGNN